MAHRDDLAGPTVTAIRDLDPCCLSVECDALTGHWWLTRDSDFETGAAPEPSCATPGTVRDGAAARQPMVAASAHACLVLRVSIDRGSATIFSFHIPGESTWRRRDHPRHRGALVLPLQNLYRCAAGLRTDKQFQHGRQEGVAGEWRLQSGRADGVGRPRTCRMTSAGKDHSHERRFGRNNKGGPATPLAPLPFVLASCFAETRSCWRLDFAGGRD